MKTILDGLDSIEFDRNKKHIFHIKSAIVWGMIKNSQFPLLYISKPKNISQEDFDAIIDKIDFNINK